MMSWTNDGGSIALSESENSAVLCQSFTIVPLRTILCDGRTDDPVFGKGRKWVEASVNREQENRRLE